MTKWPVHKQTHRTAQKHVKQPDATDIQNKTSFLCVSFFFLFFYDF